MPIPNAEHKTLKGLLKEEHAELLEKVEGWFDAAGAKDKVQKANEEMTKERDGLKDEVKESKEKITGLEKSKEENDGEIKRLQENMLTDEDKEKFKEFKKSGVTSDMQKEYDAKINKLTGSVEKLTTTIEEEKGARAESDKKAAEALLKQQQTELDKKLTTAFTGKKITGKNVRLALSLVREDGLAELKQDENNGGMVEKYYILDEDKKFRDATIDEVAEYVATNHENLVDSSGVGGSGLDHQSTSQQGGGASGKKLLHEYRNDALEMIATEKK